MWYRWACLSCAILASPAYAADELAFGPAPSWVMNQPFQTGASQNNDAPIDFLLSDAQVKLEPGMVANYSHNAVRINNPQGLAAGNVIAIWDPAFEVVTFHQVTIQRGGQRIDVLGKGQKFTILRREQNLEQQTLDGRLTATLQPEGLQVGDILEVEMSQVRRDPTLRGHMELRANLGLPMRIDLAQLRLLTPSKAAIRQRLAGGLSSPTVSKKGDDRISSWILGPLLPERPPAFAPPRFTSGKAMEVTDFQSWNDLAALFLPLFEQASAIPADSQLHQEIARIKAASSDPAKRAELALQLVEQKIRYVNLALGVGGLVPASASETWERRFGDCKAKSALLVGLLRELGIEAVPVLVNSEQGDGLNERLPMISLFNHVVVRANIGGKTYWLDGTRTGDTSLDTLETPFFHWGLPIVANADLVKIVPPPRSLPSVETIVHTDASAGSDKPVPTKIDLVMRGDLAILQNTVMSSLDASLRDQAMRKQLQAELDRFEIDKVTATYDAATQVYRLRGEGRQTLDLNDGVYWSEVPSPGYKADFRRTGTRDQDAPVKISYPTFSRNVQTIVIPKDRLSQTTFQVAPIATTVAGIEYRRNVTNANGVVTVEQTSRALVPEIPYAEALAAENQLRELDKKRVWIRMSNSAPVDATEIKELIGREPKTADDYMSAAIKLLDAREQAKAIGSLDKAIDMAPANSSARSLRAQLRMAAGDWNGAKADAQETLKADPRDVQARMLLAEAYRREGNVDSALAAAAPLSKVDNARSQIGYGQFLLSLDRPSEALAAFDRALSFEKDPMTHAYRAQALPASDKSARRKELDAAVKLNPADARSLNALAQLAIQLGEYDRALQLLDQAFLKSPDDLAIRHTRAVALMLAKKADAANREFDAISAKDLTAPELNNLCWTKALANVALDRALDECNRSLAKDDSFAAHDSKAVVLLRQSRLDEAIAEFDLALKGGEFAAALYGRALANARKGDRAKSDADAAEAMKLAPGIERTYESYGLVR